jgi:hypothetical protein
LVIVINAITVKILWPSLYNEKKDRTKLASFLKCLQSTQKLKRKPGVNFTNVLRAAFAPVDLRPTYWRTAQRGQRRSWADFLVLWTRRVGRRFVGETEWRKRMTTSAFALCASGLVKLTPGANDINISGLLNPKQV